MNTKLKIISNLDRAILSLLVLYCLTAVISISLSEIGYFGAFFVWLVKIAYTGELNLKRTPADLPFVIFTFLTLCAVFIGLDGLPELSNKFKPLSLMLMFPLVVNNVKDKKTVYYLFLCFFVSGLLQSAVIIYKGFTTKNLSLGLGIGGTMSVTLTAGELLVTLLGAALSFFCFDKDKKVRALAFFTLTLGFIALAFTLARGAWVAFIGVLLVFAFLGRKKIFGAVLLALILLFCGSYYFKDHVAGKKIYSIFKLTSGTTPQRFAMWRSGLRMVQDHPLGVGIDNVIKKYKNYCEPEEKNRIRGHLHNNYLQIAVERGVFALAAFLWLLYIVVKTVYLNYLRSTNYRVKVLCCSVLLALTAFMVAGVFEYGLGSAIYAPFFWFLAALAVIIPKIPEGKGL